jgi:hypothetical protein
MLIKEIKYRLGEYIIIEHGSVLLTWVSHIALGAQRSGKCFIIGNILVIGNCDHEEAGYLKLEFHEHLIKLPVWKKTRYYCFASSLRKVGTEQSLTSDLIEQLSIEKIDMEVITIAGSSTFRLGRYEITVNESSIISWQTIGELNRTIGGTCITESGILFIGPKEVELDEGQSRQKFLAGLKLLPQWDKTFAWGYYGSLMICTDPGLRRSYAAILEPEYVKTRTTINVPFSHSQEIRKARISEFKASDFGWLITAWRRVVGWKVWGRLTPLIIEGVFFGLRILVFVVGKIADLFRWIIKMFRKHRKKTRGDCDETQ